MLPIYSVTDLNRQIKQWLEQDVGEICVQGELSNLSKPGSGHWYFTLKDSQAQLRCVFFRNRQTRLHQALGNGDQVLAEGYLSLYEARGDYQLIVTNLVETGLGDLHQQFALLKEQLAALGLFDAARKKPLPLFPQTIGLISSPTGAALHDMLTTLARRYPMAAIRIYPSDVQGKLAAGQLAAAIHQANQEDICDVLILARGGGSLEDLWAFNEAQVAHAIAASHIPLVTGIGHETDVTIADFVADVRAATPTAAAEMVSPLQAELANTVSAYAWRLLRGIRHLVQQQRLLLTRQVASLRSPQRMIGTYWQSLDYLERQLHQSMPAILASKHHQAQVLFLRLQHRHPGTLLAHARQSLDRSFPQLIRVMRQRIMTAQQGLETMIARLEGVGPVATLARGYALATHAQEVITDANTVLPGTVITVRLAKGALRCEVLSKD